MKKMTIKDFMLRLGISYSTAQRYFSDCKQEFSIKIVTEKHFKEYFKV